MEAHEFEPLYRLEEKYWWFIAMRKITDTIAARELQNADVRILDAGCGTGFNLAYFSANGKREVFGIDIADAALAYIRKRGLRNAAQASITDIPFQSEIFDIVFSFEALTQIALEAHDRPLREMFRILKLGGHLFLRVPAFMWLYSSHDEGVGNRYRYTREQLAAKLRDAGFVIEWISYANSFLFPIILFQRFLKRLGMDDGSDVKPLPAGMGWMNEILRSVLSAEAAWFKSGRRLPFGLSLICYARRPNAG